MNPETIKIPAVEEGACLLHLTGLPLVPRDTSKALFFSYPFNTTGTEQAGEEDEKVVGSFKAWPVAELFGQPLIMKLPDGSFPEAKTGIKIIQFTGCDESKAKALMKAIAEKVPDSIFDSDNLDRGKGFITGISLRESLRESVRTEPEQKKLLTLFISIPHLGPAAQPLQGVLPHSKTLQEYRFMQTPAFPPTAVPDEIVRVYQTWFLLFDNDTIGIFRSEDDKLADRAPLFPFQDRRGGVQALVHMLSSSITITERTALKDFRQKATDLEWKLWSNIQAERTAIDRAAAATPTEKAEAEASLTTARSQVEFSTLLFERTMVDLSTILRLVRYQIQKLEELLRVIQNGSMPREWNKHPRNSNPFEIDGIAHEKEQTKDAHDTLKWMVEEREKALAQINSLNQDLEGVLSRLSQTRNEGLVRDQKELAKELAKEQGELAKELAKEQGELAKELAKEQSKLTKKQGQTISVFTYVTTVFLPLGFFCAYFSINPPGYEQTIHTRREFWTTAGPATLGVVVFMLIFLFGKDDAMKEWVMAKWKKLQAPPLLPYHI